jgi:23S rRNA (cytosine1962-C5)-methyltransferase
MQNKNIIRITPKGRRRLESGHPWIFKSDLLKPLPDKAGIASVLSQDKTFLANALFSPGSQISLRILTRKQGSIGREWFAAKIRSAVELRGKMNIPSNAVRIIFGESDGLPGLIVDRYDDVISFQTLCAGAEIFRGDFIDILMKELKPRTIVERNDVPSRKIENLPARAAVVKGIYDKNHKIKEGNFSFFVDVLHGQKTGAYLDQRDNRILAGSLAYGSVLDCFSYEGWFGVHMSQNAGKVLCVESSAQALLNAQRNIEENGVKEKVRTLEANCFDFLKQEDLKKARYDCINLDPPPFVKSSRDRVSGFRGYKEINLRAMKMLRPKGLLFTSSCSYNFSDDDFDFMLASAASDAGVRAQVMYKRNAAADHPNLISFPESNYLKFRVLYITA